MIRRGLDEEPMVVVASALGVLGVVVATVAPRVRFALGYDAEQYFQDEDPFTGKRRGEPVVKPGQMMAWRREEVGAKPQFVERDEDE